MKFNDVWTKEINDRYRYLVKNKYSIDYILEELKDYVDYHPKNKFKVSSVMNFYEFITEVKFNPKIIPYQIERIPSIRYKNEKD